MQERRKRGKTGIFIAVAAVVIMVALMVVWQQYEAKHKAELKSSLLTTDVPNVPTAEEPEPQPAKPTQVIPDNPERLLVMAQEALKDEGYFEDHYSSGNKGYHVYSLLKKCLSCDGNPGEVEELAKRLKGLSSQGYGTWYVHSDNLADLDDRIKKAKQM